MQGRRSTTTMSSGTDVHGLGAQFDAGMDAALEAPMHTQFDAGMEAALEAPLRVELDREPNSPPTIEAGGRPLFARDLFAASGSATDGKPVGLLFHRDAHDDGGGGDSTAREKPVGLLFQRDSTTREKPVGLLFHRDAGDCDGGGDSTTGGEEGACPGA